MERLTFWFDGSKKLDVGPSVAKHLVENRLYLNSSSTLIDLDFNMAGKFGFIESMAGANC